MKLAPWLAEPWRIFCERLQQDRLSHALQVRGPEGCAKSDLARAMTERLLCLSDETFACGECRSCTLRIGGAHPDFFRLSPPEGKHQITVDQVRELIAQTSLTTSFSRRKVALFEPAEAMNVNAANALLKCLEEPVGDTVLVLVTHNAGALPVTINSRCQSVVVTLPDSATGVGWLIEEHGLTHEQAEQAMAAAGQAPLTALGLHREGLVDVHGEIRDGLWRVLEKPGAAPGFAHELVDLDDERVWTWLSRFSAELMKGASVGKEGTAQFDRRAVSELQLKADRFRKMSRSAVRQDLLLRDWLIEWARLGSG